MSMLLPTLFGVAIGAWMARRMHLDEIETIADLSFAVLGAWTGGLLAFLISPYTLGAGTTLLAIILNLVGAVLGAVLYKVLFHPHQEGHHHPKFMDKRWIW
jgi:glycopeptide antibiotics resistance protein